MKKSNIFYELAGLKDIFYILAANLKLRKTYVYKNL